MEREYLVNGIIVIFVLVVVFAGFLALFPQVKDRVMGFSTNFLGLGFAKAPEQIRETVSFMKDSLDLCSSTVGEGCICSIDMDAMPSDYYLLLENSGASSKFLILDSNQRVDTKLDLGRRLGIAMMSYDDSKWSLFCNFKDYVLHYSSGWKYKQGDFDKEVYSSDGVSTYPVIKLADGNFCLVPVEDFLEYEKGVGEVGNPISFLVEAGFVKSANDFVKIKDLIPSSGFMKDYYSGQANFNSMQDCGIVGNS